MSSSAQSTLWSSVCSNPTKDLLALSHARDIAD